MDREIRRRIGWVPQPLLQDHEVQQIRQLHFEEVKNQFMGRRR